MDPQYSGRLDQNCQGNFCTLSIKKLRESDQGTYKLRFITNVDGGVYTVKTGVTLDVTAAQVQVIKAEERDYYTRASLSCHTSCTPAASLSWCWKQNRHWNDYCLINRRTKEQKLTLYPGDDITCAVGGYPSTASPPLYALEAPRVLGTKDDIMEGDSLTFTCRADTPTSSGHRWCKKTGTSDCDVMSYGEYLVFSSIQSSDSAVYCCVVENDLGQKMSQPFVIDVKYAPRSCYLSVDPIKEIKEGNQVTLTCSCDANPAAKFTWYKGQTKLRSSERNYVFNSIRPQDSGRFYCKAHNKHGDVTSDPVVIDVQFAPRFPDLRVSPSNVIKEGTQVNLTCISDANPAASFTWYKGQTALGSSERNYVFNSIRPEDSGSFYCKAYNKYGHVNSDPVFINVQFAPRFPDLRVSPSNVIKEGTQVNLTCISDANPAASFTWYKGQTALGSSERNYVFNSIRPEDSGSFYCKAYNKYGHVNSDPVFINVQYLPRLPTISARPSSNVKMGSSVSLNCSSDANPTAHYVWYKNLEKLDNSEGPMFNISNFQLHNEGEYHCEARNSRGSRRAALLLQAQAGSLTGVAVGCAMAGILLILLLVTILLLRKKITPKCRMLFKSQPNTSEDASGDQPNELVYSMVEFSKHSPIYSNVTNAKRDQDEDQYESVDYTAVKCSGQASKLRPEVNVDVCAVYSTVQKKST
ncbi:B-cell receptor CD22-like isoform X2 [Corythoichthys intestinalis]|nr:B-cell receptor CD22-like isoform X2 [Corythoichthys intestinalis]